MRSIDSRLWTNPRFLALSNSAKLSFLEQATGPVGEYVTQTGERCGLSEGERRRAQHELVAAGFFPRELWKTVAVPLPYVASLVHGPAVYFVSVGGERIKIGWTTDIETRVATLQTANADRLYVRALIRGSMEDERRLHAKFAHLRVSGEWFREEPELSDYIEAINRGEVEEVA
ncbi:MAG: GIY-YIG nuclease family protein [Deltaproteobacteria bacterium]|nr:GIY-YIG nuclease family protein [Myxococcales bacterium]MDP3220048.1 GIY-YIG nuclease family protein [Deltaproteobacteria bacterium]